MADESLLVLFCDFIPRATASVFDGVMELNAARVVRISRDYLLAGCAAYTDFRITFWRILYSVSHKLIIDPTPYYLGSLLCGFGL